jgi:hypothetical protein
MKTLGLLQPSEQTWTTPVLMRRLILCLASYCGGATGIITLVSGYPGRTKLPGAPDNIALKTGYQITSRTCIIHIQPRRRTSLADCATSLAVAKALLADDTVLPIQHGCDT